MSHNLHVRHAPTREAAVDMANRWANRIMSGVWIWYSETLDWWVVSDLFEEAVLHDDSEPVRPVTSFSHHTVGVR